MAEILGSTTSSTNVAPPFDHRDSGTAESFWAGSALLRGASPLNLVGVSQLIVVAAHPDDETLGAGGLMAMADRQGLPVTVIVATLGEKSHPQSPTSTPDELAQRRRAEVFAALGVVAPKATVQLLGLPDGELSAHRGPLRAAITTATRTSAPLIVSPWLGDGHPDHQAAAEAALEAAASGSAKVWQYLIWAWHFGTPDTLPALYRLELDPADRAAKLAALECHRSQTEPLSAAPGDEAIIPPDFARHFERDFEMFLPFPAGRERGETDPDSLDEDFFDDFYRSGPDPWGFESRWYEQRKRAITLAALPQRRYRHAFEPGCSIGVLTAELAERCDQLLATDISAAPLAAARLRLAHRPGVRFEQLRTPQQWPAGRFDLIVLSEVGYYCGSDDLEQLARLAAGALTEDGALVACHWRHAVAEYPLNGDEVHRVLCAQPDLSVLVEHVEEDFVLHVLVRPPARSVARTAGLLG